MNKHAPPPGMSDLFEYDLLPMEEVREILFRVARSYGFARIDTPTVERLSLFSETETTDPEKCFVFPDKHGRQLILRPDINAPISRAVVNRLTTHPLPLKLFFLGKVFRYRRAARREFRMFGLETFGISDLSADVEIIEAVVRMVGDAGVSHCSVRINDLLLLKKLLPAASPMFLYEIRFSHNREEMIRKATTDSNVDPELLRSLLGAHDTETSRRVLDHLSRTSPSLAQEVEKLLRFYAELHAVGIPQVEIVLEDLHGLGFYSGLTYQIRSGTTGLADGGRYDHLTQLLGGPILPATGIGLGLERLIETRARQTGPLLPQKKGMYVVCENVDPVARQTIHKEIGILRSKGFIIEIALRVEKRSRVIRYAQARGYAKVLFLSLSENSLQAQIIDLKLTTRKLRPYLLLHASDLSSFLQQEQ